MVALNKTYRKTLTPDRSAKDLGHRFYSPEISRWLNRDPIGEEMFFTFHVQREIARSCDPADDRCVLQALSGLFRLRLNEELAAYAICHNNPLNERDPLGLLTCTIRLDAGHFTGYVKDVPDDWEPGSHERWGPISCFTSAARDKAHTNWGGLWWVIPGWPWFDGFLYPNAPTGADYGGEATPTVAPGAAWNNPTVVQIMPQIENAVLAEINKLIMTLCCTKVKVRINCEILGGNAVGVGDKWNQLQQNTGRLPCNTTKVYQNTGAPFANL
jgi:hypothetical protein